MTDVTGFGLLGHLIEMAEGSGLSAEINYDKVKLISENLLNYIEMGSVPGGTHRNWDSYGHKVEIVNKEKSEIYKNILADPQTSGGLLVSVSKKGYEQVVDVLNQSGLNYFTEPIGEIVKLNPKTIMVY